MRNFPEKLTMEWVKTAYEKGSLTPEELVEEIIRRAGETRDKNIWITPPSRELTEKYIKRLPARKEGYPLWGIPFAIKDNIDLEHVPTTVFPIPRKKAHLWWSG